MIAVRTRSDPEPGTSKPLPVRSSDCRTANGIETTTTMSQRTITSRGCRSSSCASRSVAPCTGQPLIVWAAGRPHHSTWLQFRSDGE